MERPQKIHAGVAHMIATVTLSCLMGCAPNMERQTLEESHLADYARFGRSVDISLVTAVVGAYQEPGTNIEEGAAYVFTKSLQDNLWSPQARLEPAVNEDIEFGDAVAISLNTIAVGAPRESFLPVNRSGAVHIFERSGSAWAETGEVSSIVHQPWEAFGEAVALDGDDLVVGAPARDQPSAVDAGGAFVFHRTGLTWAWQQDLVGPSPVAGDGFGSEVDIAGDTLVVAAAGRALSSTAPAAGAVYVYQRSAGVWTLAQTLTASDAAAADLFGSSVDLERHSDGSRRLVVGAEHADPAGFSNAGAAYVFDAAPGGPFVQAQKLVASDPGDDAIFGDDVAVSGGRILIGAPGANSGAIFSGAAYAFELTGGSWSQSSKLSSSPVQASGSFGAAVALSGQDGLVGAPNEAIGPSSVSAGAVHAFVKPTSGPWAEDQRLNAASAIDFHVFGQVLSLAGDRLAATALRQADTFARSQAAWSEEQALPALPSSQIFGVSTDGSGLAVFGRRNPPSLGAIGYVQIYTRAGGGWALQQQFDPDLVSTAIPSESANMGRVSLLGDTLAIGAPRWNDGDGRVLIWRRSGTVWSPAQLFTSPQAATNIDTDFGIQVQLNGQTLIVAEVPSSGVPGALRSGSVYVYTDHGGSFVQDQVITETPPTYADGFGSGIAIDGDLLAIFSPATDTLRVYRRSAGVFTSIWSLAIPDVHDARDRLAMRGDRIALGIPAATVNGVANVGEVVILRRQPDDTYVPDRLLQASDGVAGMNLGLSVAMDGVRVVAGTVNTVGKVYTFDL